MVCGERERNIPSTFFKGLATEGGKLKQFYMLLMLWSRCSLNSSRKLPPPQEVSCIGGYLDIAFWNSAGYFKEWNNITFFFYRTPFTYLVYTNISESKEVLQGFYFN